MSDATVTLYHAPRTRSAGVLFLLEELGAPYQLEVLNRKAGEHREPAFLAINPMGKVPALRDATGAVVTEQVASESSITRMAMRASCAVARCRHMSRACAWLRRTSDSSRRMVVRAAERLSAERWYW